MTIAASVYLRPEHLITADCVKLTLRFGDVEVHFARDLDTAAAQLDDLRRLVRGMAEHVDALLRDMGQRLDQITARDMNTAHAERNTIPFGHPVSPWTSIPLQPEGPDAA